MQMLIKYHVIISLFFILTLGFFFRIVNLSNNPPGFFADEASIGYNAYTILNFGTDEYGTQFPFFFRAFGEYKNPIQTYSTVPFIAIFGLNEFSVRLPSVLYGMLSIVAIFFLSLQLFHEQKYKNYLALLSALFLAISPWHIHFSRTSLEGLSAFVAFTTIGVFFFLKAQKRHEKIFVSIIFFVLAFYSYFPARLFIPLFVGVLVISHYRFFLLHKKNSLLALLLIFITALPILTSISSEGAARWQQVSIFTNPPKDRSVADHIINNYVSHFTPSFLFLRGDIDMPGQFITRHSVRGMGELYVFQLPLILTGIYFLVKQKQKTPLLILFSWLLLYPLGSMFTLDTNAQATRSIIGVIPFQLLSAFGLAAVVIYKHRYHHHHKSGSVAITIVILLSIYLYARLLFVEYPKYAADFWGWQYGAREVVSHFKKEDSYDEFFLAPEFNAPDIFLKFYAPEGCHTCHIGLPHETHVEGKKQLYAITPVYINEHSGMNFQVKKTIFYPNRSVAFQIVEVVE